MENCEGNRYRENGIVILEWALNTYYARAWTGFIWLRMGTSCWAVVSAVMNLLVAQNTRTL